MGLKGRKSGENESWLYSIFPKLFLPVVFGGALMLGAAIFLMWYCVTEVGNYAVFSHASACLNAFTNGNVSLSLTEYEVRRNSDHVFQLEWKDNAETIEYLKNVEYEVVPYEYIEAEKHYVVVDGFTVPEWGLTTLAGEYCDELDEKQWAWYDYKDAEKSGFDYSWLYVRQGEIVDGEPIRVLGIGVDTAEAKAVTSGILKVFAISMFIIVALAQLVMGIIIYITVRRMHKISDYLSLMETGLPDNSLRLRSRDEIGQMAASINRMVQGLKDRERMEGELNVATSIQTQMLPLDFDAYRGKGFEIFASMSPAKEVGGDFYDFYMPDETHLAMVIADVSGKGVPAAMFMAIGKTLLRIAISSGGNLSDEISALNNYLCANNTQNYFITMWVGLLDLETGSVRYINAGHCTPALRRVGGQFGFLQDEHGLMLGMFEDVRYNEKELVLRKGDKLFLYTDGVTEATRADERMYQSDSLLEYLNAHRDESLRKTLEGLKADVDKFVGEAPQFDDITMLMVRYLGKKPDRKKPEDE